MAGVHTDTHTRDDDMSLEYVHQSNSSSSRTKCVLLYFSSASVLDMSTISNVRTYKTVEQIRENSSLYHSHLAHLA